VNRRILDAADYEREMENCRVKLTKRLQIKELPDAVWGYLVKLGLVYDAILHPDSEDDQQALIKAARARLEKLREETPTLQRGPTSDERTVKGEVHVELSDQIRKRGQVFEEVAATLAANHPQRTALPDNLSAGTATYT
jgi:hypothetical protein